MQPNDRKKFEKLTYIITANSMEDVVKSSPTYTEIMRSFAVGDVNVKFRKRFLLKKIDELWISAIEDALPALDTIIRNPQFRLQEKEEVLPVEISKHVNGRSVIHLTQHTDLITDIKEDGSVVPSKLLNVFQEDTMLTYENKFINTLVNRLYSFVAIRYNGARECGEDEKNTSITMDQKFEHKDYRGKISLNIEIGQDPKEHEVIKNYIYSSDLWKRVEKIYDVVSEYLSSSFIQSMGRNYVHPPIMRTNVILKNPLFKDCLSLWEFMDSYENTGYESLVQEDLLQTPNKLLEDLYNTIAEQYVIFQTHIDNDYEQQKALDSRLLNINPKIQDELDELDEDEFDYKTLVPEMLTDEIPLEASDAELEYAILVALTADSMMYEEEAEGEQVAVINEEDGGFEYRYKYSFLARLIRAQLPAQDYYNEIKNFILSYEGTKSFLSWSRELFKHGRTPIAKLNCKGKTLFVYHPPEPKEFDANKYHHLDVSKEGKEVEYPFLLKVRSKRACKYAKELLALVMERNEIAYESYEDKDYHIAPMSIEELLEKDLARRIDDPSTAMPKFDEPEEEEIEEVEEEAPVVEEAPTPEVAPVTEEDDGFAYKYKFSFSARLILSGEERQNFYNNLKNEILSYKKVNSKISWSHELFKLGRNKIALFKVRGKTLCVYLPLDPDKYDQEHYHFSDERVEGKEVEFPMMLKVKSDRGVKYASELVRDVMSNLGIEKLEEYEAQDYKLPEMSIDEMLVSDPVLAKLIDGSPLPVIEKKPEPVVEEVKVEEPAPVVVDEEDDGFAYKYKFSFSARLILSGDERQEFYNAIKNNILSYKKVNSKISWSHELFKLGRIKIAQLKVKGKTLCVYLPLDPNKYDADRLHFKETNNEEFPMMMKVKSDRAVKYVAELIADVMANNEIVKLDEYEAQNYKLPEMSIEEMLISDPVLAKLIDGSEIPVIEKKPEPVVEEVKVEEVAPVVETEEEEGFAYKYKFSFSARLILAGDERQKFYNEIKNFILSYKKVNSKISWSHEFFKLGRIKLAQMKVKGKTLCVYLPLDPSKYDVDRLHFKETGNEEFPMMMKVKSDRAVKYVKELMMDVMANNEIIKNDNYEAINYKLKEMSLEEMLQAGLVKSLDGSQVVSYETKEEENSSNEDSNLAPEPVKPKVEEVEPKEEIKEEEPQNEESVVEPQKEEKKGFFARLFGRKSK